MSSWIRWATTGLMIAVASLLCAPAAAAHPTDEVVQQVYLTPAASGLGVRLDLTPGVLVAPQFARTLDVDANGTVTDAEVDAHVAAVQSAVTAQVDGRTVDLTVTDRRYPPLELLAAAGGTITLEWRGELPADAHQVVFTDRYDSGGRPAVQMSVLVAADAVEIGRIEHADEGRTTTVPLNPSTPGPGAAAAAGTSGIARVVDHILPTRGMIDGLRQPLSSPWALLVLVGACCLLGAVHALTPGHGKALLAAYLVGDRGTPREAVALGAVITFTHTAAVLALGAVALAAGSVLPGVVVPVLTVVAGVVVLVLGVRLMRRRWGSLRAPDHAHEHGHGSLSTRPTSLRGIAALGAAAGLIPCPEALSVLLLAVGLNRTALGLGMIVAFSVGLAAVLVGLGLLLVTAAPALSRFTSRRSGRVVAHLPLLSAVVVAILGGAMTVTGVSSLAG